MKSIIRSEKLPIYLWLKNMESGALEQAKNLANFPYAFHHIAIMPDAHQGYGMPIGGVMATKDVIVPNAVGVDIGCGMCIVRTSLYELSLSRLKMIMSAIRSIIPLGFEHHKHAQDEMLIPLEIRSLINDEPSSITAREYKKALRQIGTLGGGNHFIEFLKGSDNFIYIMVHSGSRNIGKQIADHYYKKAKEIRNTVKKQIPSNWMLDYLPMNDDLGKMYFREMNAAVAFAFANRKHMMNRIKECISEEMGIVEYDSMVNIAHNYAALECHFGQDVYVHRKGATLATRNTIGLIPGSMGSKSYMVRGKGNLDSFNSCSHGAGRAMGRNQARRQLSLKYEQEMMDKQGILHGLRGARDLDEAPGAYKDISVVMENQQDLVDILVELLPIAVIKG